MVSTKLIQDTAHARVVCCLDCAGNYRIPTAHYAGCASVQYLGLVWWKPAPPDFGADHGRRRPKPNPKQALNRSGAGSVARGNAILLARFRRATVRAWAVLALGWGLAMHIDRPFTAGSGERAGWAGRLRFRAGFAACPQARSGSPDRPKIACKSYTQPPYIMLVFYCWHYCPAGLLYL